MASSLGLLGVKTVSVKIPAILFYRLKHNLHLAFLILRQIANNSYAEQPCSESLGWGRHSR